MMASLRRYLVAGLLVWVPLWVTVLIVKFLIDLMDQTLVLLPEAAQPEHLLGFRIPGLGFVLTFVVVLVTGIIAANLFGRQLVRVWEGMLARIPLVRSIYSAVKQVMETVFSNTGQSFRRVALVEYPRKDVWTLAFVTGEGIAEVQRRTGQDMVSVFVPTTPNPTSGFFLMLPRAQVIDLDMPVEVGLKLILSAGVVAPEQEPKGASIPASSPAAP